MLRALIDNLPDYIYVKDAYYRHLINNKANVSLIGASTEEETLGKTAYDFFESSLAEKYIEDDKKVFESGKPPVRIFLTERLTSESLVDIARRHRGIVAVLAVQTELIVAPGIRTAVIDLMRAERHGEMVPDGPCKSLLSRFL